MQTKRILLFCEYTSLNGGERSLLSVLPRILQHSFDVAVALPSEGELVEAIRSMGMVPIPFDFYDADGVRLSKAALRDSLDKVIQQAKPDLFHANSLMAGRLAGPVTSKLKIPSVAHLRDIIRLSRTALDDLTCHSQLVAVSDATRCWYVSLGVPADLISVVHNGVDLRTFVPRTRTGWLHGDLNLPSSSKIIGGIGQIGMRKGWDVLFRAMAKVVQTDATCHLVVVGQRHSRKEEAVRFEEDLHRQAQQAPLRGHVHFLGTRVDVPELLAEFDVLVHPARQEPLGRVLLEAAATGLPIVATDVGGTTDIFPRELKAAVLVPPEDHSALAESVLAVTQDRKWSEQLGQDARKRAETCFSADTAADNLMTIYQQLCTSNRSAR